MHSKISSLSKSVIHECPPNSEIRAFVQLEHRGMKCTFVAASEKEKVCACNIPTWRDCFLHKVLAVTVLSWDTGSDQGFWTLALHLTYMQTKICFCKKDVVLWDKKTQPNQPKLLQAMEEVMEMYKRLRRMWYQISSPDLAEETYSSAISDSLLGLGIKKRKKEKSMSEEINPCHHSPLCFPFTLYEEGSPSLCAK